MGYGARARVQVGIRTEVEPVWGHTPSLAPISLPSAALGLLPCAHLAQRSAIPRSKTQFYTPFCGTVSSQLCHDCRQQSLHAFWADAHAL